MAMVVIDSLNQSGVSQNNINQNNNNQHSNGQNNINVCRYCGRKMKWSEQWHQYICQHCGSQSPIGVVKVDNI